MQSSKQCWLNIFDRISEYSLYGIVFHLPISSTIVEIFFGFLLFSYIGKKFLCPDFKFLISSKNILLLLFFLSLSLSLFNSGPFFVKSLRALFSKWLEYIFIYLMALDIFTSKKRKNIAIGILLWYSFFVSWSCLCQKFLGFEFIRQRPLIAIDGGFWGVTGPFTHYNDCGTYLIAMLSLTLASLWVMKRRFVRYSLIALAVLLIVSLSLTLSRGAWLGATVALIFMLVISKQFKILSFFVFFGFLLLFSQDAKERIFSIFIAGGDSQRFIVWQGAWAMIKENIFLGKGLGTFMDYFPQYVPSLSTRYAHNCFLQIWAESGIWSLLSFVGFIFIVLKQGINQFRKEHNFLILGVTSALMGLVIHSLFDTVLYSLQLSVLFWVLLGMVSAEEKGGSADSI